MSFHLKSFRTTWVPLLHLLFLCLNAELSSELFQGKVPTKVLGDSGQFTCQGIFYEIDCVWPALLNHTSAWFAPYDQRSINFTNMLQQY
ncbi:hypothetical protein GDO86_003001 [Hymenochirus boettgeri]|uniref:Uncharacterized protein n=1 Tax=Hymenochirus boettgeri TaxID=247094 RepID=A0A8T2K4L4_9PIPI|nr:hypothetical protein GDO86_003001 [Hymenochirus boettgeri]